MLKTNLFPWSASLLAILLLSCASGGPTIPEFAFQDQSENQITSQNDANPLRSHYLWGYFIIEIDTFSNEVNIVPIRNTTGHWNVLKLLEQAPCSTCLQLAGIVPSGNGTFLVDVKLIHPFPFPNLTGFDVRGIPMFNGGLDFPELGVSLPDRNLGTGELVNADGYTTLYNITTEGSGPGGLQGYIKGSFATNIAPDATLNGYKRHVSDDPGNTRNAFYAGDVITVTYEIAMPSAQFILGYAVDANWAPPTVKPVTDPMADFPPEANCQEPWQILTQEISAGDGLTDEGGTVDLLIDVYDYQGETSFLAPVIECPQLFNGTITADFTANGAGFTSYQVTVPNTNLAPAGYYDCLIKVEDEENASAPDWLDLSAYQIHTFRVAGRHEWTRTWGGSLSGGGYDVATDNSGYAYVAGWLWGTADLDPGAGADQHASSGMSDVVLSKFDSDGNFEWALTWGSTELDTGHGVVVDNTGSVYVTGSFVGTVDFDPGPGVDEHMAVASYDVYLSKFDSDGNFQWARTWGGVSGDQAFEVAVDDSGNIFVIGTYMDDADFDPGPGSDIHTLDGGTDCFLSAFDSAGGYLWARTWGGVLWDWTGGLDVDESGFILVSGYFNDTVDFDPGIGFDTHISSGDYDSFLSRFDADGIFEWSRTFGGTESDGCFGVAADSSDNVFVTGWFSDSVDFDPDIDADVHDSNGDRDVFLARFDSLGDYDWCRTFGGTGPDCGYGAVVDINNIVNIIGSFMDTADLDPGPGINEHTSNGLDDIFMSRYSTGGDLLWAGVWGGTGSDFSYSISADNSGAQFVTGWFKETVDFDPGPATDNHSSSGDYDAFLSKFRVY